MKFMSEENKKEVNELLSNFYIHDCCILSDKYFCMIAEEYLEGWAGGWSEAGAIKLVFYDTNRPKPKWLHASWGDVKNVFFRPKLVNTQRNEVLIVGDNNVVYYMGLKENKQWEEDILMSLSPGVAAIKRIHDDIYLVAAGRTVIKRMGISHWVSIEKSYMWDEHQSGLTAGFSDIDGFASDDLYAVGGKADVWRYDGQDWIPLDIADHIEPYTVCCADDGHVYIAGLLGVVIRGREDNWQMCMPPLPHLDKDYGGASNGFTSSVNFQGRVYLGGESIGTYFIDLNSNNKKPQQYDFNGEIEPFSARFMSVGYGMMMFANQHRAALHDGEKWIDLYGESQQLYREELGAMQTILLNADELLGEITGAFENIKKDK